MNRGKVTVYIGISLDGYIATKDDSLEWLLSVEGEKSQLILDRVRTFGQFTELSYKVKR